MSDREAPAHDKRDAAGAASTLRSVLVHVGSRPQDLVRLRAAAALARKFDATLLGVGSEQVPPLGAADPTGLMQGVWYEEMEGQLRLNLEHARGFFEAETSGLKTEWTALEAMPSDALVRLACSADIIVADSRPLRAEDRYRSAEAVEVMMRAGRPVLLVPPSGGQLSARAVVIAWKDTREARRAVADALPLLQRAEAVLLLEVCGDKETADADGRTEVVAAGLRRHGVAAHARAVAAPPERVLAEIEAAAQAIGADLIVAGGYGHTRLGEWIFGGVTRDLLRVPERFVLLSH